MKAFGIGNSIKTFTHEFTLGELYRIGEPRLADPAVKMAGYNDNFWIRRF